MKFQAKVCGQIPRSKGIEYFTKYNPGLTFALSIYSNLKDKKTNY